MRNIKFTLMLFMIFAFTSTNTFAQQFEPVDPIDWKSFGNVTFGDGQEVISGSAKDEILNMLPNEAVDVSIAKINADNTLEYTMRSTSEKNTDYIVTMDYIRYKSEQVEGKGEDAGMVKIGIGLRLTARITCLDKDINLGSLFSIAAAVEDEKIHGSLNVDIIGIKNKDVTITVPIPGVLNQTSIQNAMQSLATVKSKMYDVDAVLHPQIVAVKKKGESKDSGDVIGFYKKQLRNDALFQRNARIIQNQEAYVKN